LFDRPDTGDNALLVHIDVQQHSSKRDTPQSDLESSRQEFLDLATSAGLTIVDFATGKRARPDPRHFIGKGKIEEIKLLLKEHEVDVVLFGQRLSEGKLQVELAQLTHLSTRLVRGWTHLERQKGGIGLRGPGETQLETDRRLLNERVKTLKGRLSKVRKQREQGRSQRTKSGTATVALVGYTNAGKSTLFNHLTNEKVYAADQLFATLDPTLRRLTLPGGTAAILADTVGFISDLPPQLVEAFLSTLTETREANLLLHVIDVSDDLKDQRISDVDDVLETIGADDVPQLIVYNKIDRAGQSARIDRSESGDPVAVWLSAMTGDGLDLLLQAIAERVSRQRVIGWLHVLPEQGKLRAMLFNANAVLEERIEADGSSLLHIDLDGIDFARWENEYDLEKNFTPDTPSKAVLGQG